MLHKLVLILLGLLLTVLPVSAQAVTPTSAEDWPTHGWRTASPAEHGLDADKLAAIPDQIEQTMPFVHSLLIVRHGVLSFEP